MAGKYALDTNTVIRLFAGDQAVLNWVTGVSELYVPCIVLGELYYGAQKFANVDANTAKIIELSSRVKILPCNAETVRHFGRIKKTLRTKGKPIPENDIWIGSIIMQHNLSLVTSDTHFKEIEGMKLTEI